jgi:aldehyde dehydrogenase (NAD+)
MQKNVIKKISIDGEFVIPHGTEPADLFNPATGQVQYGAPLPRNQWMADMAVSAFTDMITTLEGFDFTRHVRKATVEMVPLGVAGLIAPWNSDAFFICNELATALAAG